MGGSAAASPRTGAWLRRYSRLVALATLFLIFAGGMVTSTGSGLAVPDWPLSYGMLFPPMVGGIFYEHGHRMIAGGVGVLIAILAFWLLRSEPRRWVRRLGVAAGLAVIAQALLGGLTVLLLLPDAVSISHAALAEIVFCLTVAIAVALSTGWRAAGESPIADVPEGSGGLARGAMLLTAIVYVQILLGAVMRHTGAGLAIPDFPLAYGRLIPASLAGGIGIHFAHRVGALVVTLGVLAVVIHVVRLHRADGWLVRPVLALLALLVVQITLGALTIWTIKAPVPTSLHVACGAATLAASLVVTLRTGRRAWVAERMTARGATTAGAPSITNADT
ncbi:MAG TPA: COX15/CtaA family protein, partial [Candidatus Eisenbacteria bacterium]